MKIKPNSVFTGTQQRNTANAVEEPQTTNVNRPSDARSTVHKAGQQHASWRNPFIANAMPAILSVRKHQLSGVLNQSEIRLQLVQEVRLFRERLAQAMCEPDQITDASYLLCTYIDEVVSDFARIQAQTPYLDEPSLLVEFHSDAWGGEDAFKNLEQWMREDHPPRLLLALYEFILSLGWQGRYRIRERGSVLLLDLRSQLHALVWQQNSPQALGTDLVAPLHVKVTGWSLRKKLAVTALAAVVLFGLANLSLDFRGRPVRAELAAWEPPVRTINLAERLPQPLPDLLVEGWLSAYKHPQGWLLVFRSDGAFDVGKAEFKPQFINNMDRLGQALAPWAGDLEVIGHTDIQPIQSAQFPSNQALSEARASAAAQALRETTTKLGARSPGTVVDREITSSGRGDTEPVDKNKTPAAFERNRRVDVLWKVIPGLHVEKRTPLTSNVDAAPPASSANSLTVRY